MSFESGSSLTVYHSSSLQILSISRWLFESGDSTRAVDLEVAYPVPGYAFQLELSRQENQS